MTSLPAANPDSARVNAARGFACLLLVTYHVIGPGEDAGIHVADASLYRYFTDLFLPIRMPLFTFLSGFVYVYKPMIREQWFVFAKRKLTRLGIPLLVATTFTILSLVVLSRVSGARSGIGATVEWSTLWKVYVYPLRHLWFLQALLGVIAAVMVLEWLRALATVKRFLAVFVVSLIAFFVEPGGSVEIFSLNQITYMLPFFLLGMGVNRFRSTLLAPAVIAAVAALFALSFIVHAHVATFGHVGVSDRRTLLAAALGFAAVICVVSYIPRSRALQWVGGFSYSIYLYHLALISFVALGADALGVHSKPLLLLLGLAGGLGLPIIVERLARRNGVAHLLLLGQYRRAKPASAPGAQVPAST